MVKSLVKFLIIYFIFIPLGIVMFFAISVGWKVLFYEQEVFLDTIKVSKYDKSLEKKDDKSKLDLISDWKFYYDISNGFFYSSKYDEKYPIDSQYEITTILLNDQYHGNEFDYLYAIGYSYGGIDIYMFKDNEVSSQSVALESHVLGLGWLDSSLLVLNLIDNNTLLANWMVFQNNLWKIVNTLEIEAKITEVKNFISLKNGGIFVVADDDILFFSNNYYDYETIYSQSELLAILGTQTFYVVQYQHQNQDILDIVFNKDTVLRFFSTTQTNNNLFDRYIEEYNPQALLYFVSADDRVIELQQNRKIYRIELP